MRNDRDPDEPLITEAPPEELHVPQWGGDQWIESETDEHREAREEAEATAERERLDAMAVTRRQAKQALLMSGLLANVQPAIDDITDDTERGMVQIFWDDSTTFERNNPQLIALGEALELSDQQIDDLFIQASEL